MALEKTPEEIILVILFLPPRAYISDVQDIGLIEPKPDYLRKIYPCQMVYLGPTRYQQWGSIPTGWIPQGENDPRFRWLSTRCRQFIGPAACHLFFPLD